MNTDYNNSINFSGIKYKIPQIEVLKRRMAYRFELDDAAETLRDTKYWHLWVDNEGFKLYSQPYDKTYLLDVAPKRHKKNLLIRTHNKDSKYKRITSFRVNFDSAQELRNSYRKILNSGGLGKMVYVIQLLEKQAEKLFEKK